MNNKERLTNLVKNYGVTKCRVDYVDFNNPRPSGRILVDVYNPNLLNEIYDIFTKDGYLDEDQNLLVYHSDFTEIEPNFDLTDKTFNKDTYDSCYRDWVTLRDRYRGSKVSIGTMLTALSYKYPKCIVEKALLSLIDSEFFV